MSNANQARPCQTGWCCGKKSRRLKLTGDVTSADAWSAEIHRRQRHPRALPRKASAGSPTRERPWAYIGFRIACPSPTIRDEAWKAALLWTEGCPRPKPRKRLSVLAFCVLPCSPACRPLLAPMRPGPAARRVAKGLDASVPQEPPHAALGISGPRGARKGYSLPSVLGEKPCPHHGQSGAVDPSHDQVRGFF